MEIHASPQAGGHAPSPLMLCSELVRAAAELAAWSPGSALRGPHRANHVWPVYEAGDGHAG